MTKKPKDTSKDAETLNKELQKEKDFLRSKIAYLEKVRAVAQEKALKTKKKSK